LSSSFACIATTTTETCSPSCQRSSLPVFLVVLWATLHRAVLRIDSAAGALVVAKTRWPFPGRKRAFPLDSVSGAELVEKPPVRSPLVLSSCPTRATT
jgi:hypothetical protein